MENPFKIISSALGMAIACFIAVFEFPKLASSFNELEWYLAIGIAALLSVLMLVQISNNATRLKSNLKPKSNHLIN